MSYTVYMHINKTNGKKYVGFTGQALKKRWGNGLNYTSKYFRNAILKYGWDGFLHIELMWNLTEIEAKKNEIIFINAYKSNKAESGYNLTSGGEGVSGYKPTKETLKRLSESHKGIKLSDEAKEKLSKFNKGKKLSEEHKRKLSLSGIGKGKGRIMSAERKGRISESCKGREPWNKGKSGEENGNAKKVICVSTNEIFNSIKECGDNFEVKSVTLSRWLSGKYKCTHEYVFMFYNEYTALQEVS